MAKIKAPNKHYNGTVGDAKFENGQAETNDEWLISWFEENGYEVDGKTEVKENAVNPNIPDASAEELKEVREQLDGVGAEYDEAETDVNVLRAILEAAQGKGTVKYSSEEEEKEAIRAELDAMGISTHPNTGIDKLRKNLEEAKAEKSE